MSPISITLLFLSIAALLLLGNILRADKDYARVGIPLTILLVIILMIALPIVMPIGR